MGLRGSEFVVSEISRVRLKLSFDLWVVNRQLPLCGAAVSSFDGTQGWNSGMGGEEIHCLLPLLLLQLQLLVLGCQDTITTTTAATTAPATTTATATATTNNNNNFIAYSHAINLNAARIQPSIGKRMLICYALFCSMFCFAFSAFHILTLFLTSHLCCEFTCLGL